MATQHDSRNCCEHLKTRLVLRRNPNGSFFWGCSTAGCRYTWSDRDRRYFGPRLTRLASGMRTATVLRLLEDGFGVDEAFRFLEGQDVRDVASLIGFTFDNAAA